MTSRIERNGPAIREALAVSSPAECRTFEREFQQALAVARDTFDLAPVESLLDRWWGIAAIRGNPLSAAEQVLVTQARRGDDSGWDVPTRRPAR